MISSTIVVAGLELTPPEYSCLLKHTRRRTSECEKGRSPRGLQFETHCLFQLNEPERAKREAEEFSKKNEHRQETDANLLSPGGGRINEIVSCGHYLPLPP
eukprot:gb/GECG01001476.1/.p1 GENE.gb/GECG01001476.1/~~gb/GECG01001476.1/.p1  ORF type:complete len:101 (+),score=13.26 gb/GECG01001476.1/:1-303(+)